MSWHAKENYLKSHPEDPDLPTDAYGIAQMWLDYLAKNTRCSRAYKYKLAGMAAQERKEEIRALQQLSQSDL